MKNSKYIFSLLLITASVLAGCMKGTTGIKFQGEATIVVNNSGDDTKGVVTATPNNNNAPQIMPYGWNMMTATAGAQPSEVVVVTPTQYFAQATATNIPLQPTNTLIQRPAPTNTRVAPTEAPATVVPPSPVPPTPVPPTPIPPTEKPRPVSQEFNFTPAANGWNSFQDAEGRTWTVHTLPSCTDNNGVAQISVLIPVMASDQHGYVTGTGFRGDIPDSYGSVNAGQYVGVYANLPANFAGNTTGQITVNLPEGTTKTFTANWNYPCK
jgi:hypothetical protein